MATDPTNLVGEGDTSIEDTASTDTGVELQDNEPDQYDDDGNLIEAPDEDEEVELDDELKLKVPKSQAQKIREAMLRQADYTRKTQEVAAARQALEAERGQFHQASEAERDADAAARAIRLQLSQYGNINWAAEIQRAEAEYQNGYEDRRSGVAAAKAQFEQLERTFYAASAQRDGLRQQREFQAQQETAKQLEEGRAEVSKIPGWSEKTHSELRAIATSPEIGFTADEIGDEISINPKVARTLLLAKEGLEARRNKAKAQSHVQAQQVQPAAKAGGGSSAPAPGVHDKLSIDEWMKRENERVRRKRA